MQTVLLIVFALLILGLLWIRFAPTDTDNWHVDPAEVEADAGVRLIGRDAPRYPADAEIVLRTFAEIALEEPRVSVLDGAIDEGMMTFTARSKVFGFPDYISVKAVDEGQVAKLAIAARPRYGGSDLGKNARRLDRWLQEMDHRLGGR